MKRNQAALGLFLLSASPALAGQGDTVDRALNVIMELCLATGSERVEIRNQGEDVVLGGEHSSITIKKTDTAGVVGGISKEMTAIMSQQATETRACTQRYAGELVKFILGKDRDDSAQSSSREGEGLKDLIANGQVLFVRSHVNSSIGYKVADSVTRRLRELGCDVASESYDAGLTVEVESINVNEPRPDASERLSWSTSVSITISVKNAMRSRVFLLAPFTANSVTDDATTSEYSAILAAANGIADYINANLTDLAANR